MPHFSDQLNELLTQAGCSSKELAAASGISEAAISRYRNGVRVPSEEQIRKLANGIAELASRTSAPMTSTEVVKALLQTLPDETETHKQVIANFNLLLTTLAITSAELARGIHVDASFVSRMRSGQRWPTRADSFFSSALQWILRRCNAPEGVSALAALTGCTPEQLQNGGLEQLTQWLYRNAHEVRDYIGDFLAKLDEFDLNEYIRSIRFDELKVPTLPFQLPTSKTYYGVEQMKEGELDFLKATVLSRSTEPVFMCSDMPMEDMAQDVDFGKKWMMGIAAMLKKGLHLNIIHNLNRPFHEMMLGLESWIPIYMTGQISPYYLNGVHNKVYCHFTYVSGAAALSGECVSGAHDNGRYYLTKSREELGYYRRRSKDLLKKAYPLMEIYTESFRDALAAFQAADAKEEGTRHSFLSAPPIYTISDALLEEILALNEVSPVMAEKARAYVQAQREITEAILQHSPMQDEISPISEEEFGRYPIMLSLSGAFLERDIPYTYEQYRQHLRLTAEFEHTHNNYSVVFNQHRTFRNIQISLHEGKWSMVSKGRAPTIHFLIRHPKLRSAIENMVLPVVE